MAANVLKMHDSIWKWFSLIRSVIAAIFHLSCKSSHSLRPFHVSPAAFVPHSIYAHKRTHTHTHIDTVSRHHSICDCQKTEKPQQCYQQSVHIRSEQCRWAVPMCAPVCVWIHWKTASHVEIKMLHRLSRSIHAFSSDALVVANRSSPVNCLASMF